MEIKKILEDIAKGEASRSVGDIKILPSDNERMKAIDMLNKMEAAEKIQEEIKSEETNKRFGYYIP